jgi:hypothetical protein
VDRHETRLFTWTTDYDDVVGVINNQQLAEAAHRGKTQSFFEIPFRRDLCVLCG